MLLGPNAHREENTLWKDKPRWFEINFVSFNEHEPGYIEIATIANEDGEGKQVWTSFNTRDKIVKWFMVATGNGKVGKWKINILDPKDSAKGNG